MSVTIKIIKTLDGLWASDEDLAEMTDEQIIDLVFEDTCELLNNAQFDVVRESS